jgi:hypothetical protein
MKTAPTMIMVMAMVAITCFACKKEDEKIETTVTGKVINYGSGEPIDSVFIILLDGLPGTTNPFINLDKGDSKEVSYNTVYTDKNGEFSIKVTGRQPRVTFAPGKQGYEYEDPYPNIAIDYRDFEAGGVYYEEVKMKAEAYFNPVFAYDPDKGPATKVIWYKVNKNAEGKLEKDYSYTTEFEGNGPFKYCNICINDGAFSIGHTYFPYELEIHRNNQIETIIDSVFIKSFETYSDTIYY